MKGIRKIANCCFLFFVLPLVLNAQVSPYSGFGDPFGLTELFKSEEGQPSYTTLSPDGRYALLSAKQEGITYIYNLLENSQLKAILPYAAEFVCFTNDGKTAYILYNKTFWKTMLAKYETDRWQLLQERLIGDRVHELAISPDKRKLLAVSGQIIRILNPASLTTEQVNWENTKLRLIQFNPTNAKQYAGINQRNNIEIRTLPEDTLVRVMNTDTARIKEIRYLPNGQELLSLNEQGELFIWSIPDRAYHLALNNVGNIKAVSNEGLFVLNENQWNYIPRADWPMRTASYTGELDETVFSDRQNKKISIAPRPILGYTRETNVLLGLQLNIVFNPKNKVKQLGFTRPSSISPALSYGFNGQVYTHILTDYFTKTGWHLVHDMGFLLKNRSYFFGIGNQADRSQRALYQNDVFMLEGTVSKSIYRRFYGGIRYHLRDDKKLDFVDAGSAELAGTHGGSLAGVGVLLQYDTRNDLFFPTNGHFIDFTYTRYDQWFGSSYRFNELKLDYRYYFPMAGWRRETSFAVQGFYQNTFGGTVPFYALPYLTADRMIRGVWRNLYIDKQALALQGELRSTFSAIDTRYGYVLFGGVGDVSSNFFNDYRPKPIGFFGMGLRRQLIPKLKLHSRLDGAVTTRGDLGFFGSVGVAF